MARAIIKCIALIIGIMALWGCATYPAPVIESDRYTNYKYQYALDIPEGWKASMEYPKDIESDFSRSFRNMSSLVMINKSSKGMIIIANKSINSAFDETIKVPYSKWLEYSEGIKKAIPDDLEIAQYNCEIIVENLADTRWNSRQDRSSYKAMPIYKIEIEVGSSVLDLKSQIDWYIYPCHNDESCMTVVFFCSDKEKFENNIEAYNAVLESLQMTKPTAK